MQKGVAPVIAAMLLVFVTASLAFSFHTDLLDLTYQIQDWITDVIVTGFSERGSRINVEEVGDCKVYLRNSGTKDISKNQLSFYSDYQAVEWVSSKDLIKEAEVTQISFYGLETGDHNLLVELNGNVIENLTMSCYS